MTEKEIAELRRRYRVDRTNISRIFGCLVSEKKEILAEFEQSLGTMSEDDADGILTLLKKIFSGRQGRNLHEIEFSTLEVNEGEEYRLISDLKASELLDAEKRGQLYTKIAETLELDSNYVILLAHDSYDVFDYSADGERQEESNTVFSYILCAVCPIKSAKPTMSYYMPGKCFRSIATDTLLARPELGFVFPAFDDRQANIYKTLYYTKNTKDSYESTAEVLFAAKLPMPAAEQKQTFGDIIEKAVGEDCSLRVVRSVHAQLAHKLEEHKNEKIEEPCRVDKSEAGEMLRYCGVEEDKIEVFEEMFDERFGEDAEVHVSNIKANKKLEVETPQVKIKIDSDAGDLIETRVIDGSKYILIRADDAVVVNGINVKI